MFLDAILSLLTFGQTSVHKAEERKRHAASLLSKVDAAVLESSMRLDHEIWRLGALCRSSNLQTDVALASLFLMRDQCKQLGTMVEDFRGTVSQKGASEDAITHLDRWAATASVMTSQVSIVAQQLEAAILSNTAPGA